MINYNVLMSGSKGNAVILNKVIMVDCGIPFKLLKDHQRFLKLVLLTHIHGDHFNKSTIKRLARERPLLRFACCEWLVKPLVDLGVEAIDVLEIDRQFAYKDFAVEPFELVHNVPNCGYKIHFPNGSVFYATDTENLNGITAPNYDLYMIEANHGEDEILERIALKKAEGQFAYERRAMQNHLSIEQANDFIYKNAGPNSQYVYLHQSEDML